MRCRGWHKTLEVGLCKINPRESSMCLDFVHRLLHWVKGVVQAKIGAVKTNQRYRDLDAGRLVKSSPRCRDFLSHVLVLV